MNKRIDYRYYENYFDGKFSWELDSIVTDGVYDFEDWIRDNVYRNTDGNFSVEHEKGSDTYYIVDGCNERTGQMYVVISEEDTDEELRG